MTQIVTFNSINSATGKTLLAAHLAVMLAKDYKVAVMDNEGEKSPLAAFIAKRHVLNLSKNFSLPTPAYHSLHSINLDDMQQEYDLIILDSPEDKYFKFSDIFITPLLGEDGLASVVNKDSMYAALLWEARKRRAAAGKSAFRWIIIPNDIFTSNHYDHLKASSKLLGYAVAPALTRRPEYAAGLAHGVTTLDKDLPELKTLFDLPDLYARRELKKLAEFIWQNK